MAKYSSLVSSIPELALDARRAAVEDVEKLLQHPEDLKRLLSLHEDFSAKYQANKAQLSATVSSQVEAAKSGLELLDKAQKTLARTRECYRTIDRLCSECASLIENHEKIQLLSAVHYNLGKTLQDVENIVALPNEAAEAEEMLRDDVQLLQAYECLAILEGTSSMAQRALEGGSKLKREDSHNLSSYFNKVKQTMGKFEERLWSIIRNFIALGRDNPAQLVNAVRIVELQELVDKQLASSAQAGTGLTRKAYRKRAEQQIGMAIQDTFATLLQKCSQLAAAGENTDARTSEILEEAHGFVAQLADIYDYVAPCFPAKYNIFTVIWREYHEHLAFMLDCVGACSQQLANSDILKVMGWVNSYADTLREFGVEEDQVAFPTGNDRGLTLLINKYIERTHSTLRQWFAHIIESDFDPANEPKMTDGKFWTPGAVDFFRILNEQIGCVEEVTQGEMLLRTAQAAVQIMREFQAEQERHLRGELSIEMLCAVVNNNTRCYDESLEFAERLEEALSEQHKGKLDIEGGCRGFLELSRSALAALSASVFADPAFADLFHKLCASDDWRAGVTTGQILATLGDYLQDFEGFLDPQWYKRLTEMVLDETVAHYVAALLTYTRIISEDVLKAIQRDDDALHEFFEKAVKPDRVRRALQVLTDLRDLAASDSTEAFVLAYTALLQLAPGITPALIEKLVVARTDITKADVKEIMEQCREVYSTRQRALGEDGALAALPPPAKGKAAANALRTKDGPFQVALLAAKRRPAPIT